MLVLTRKPRYSASHPQHGHSPDGKSLRRDADILGGLVSREKGRRSNSSGHWNILALKGNVSSTRVILQKHVLLKVGKQTRALVFKGLLEKVGK